MSEHITLPKDKYTSAEYQNAVGDMVGREVYQCLSSLIYTLSRGYGESMDNRDLSDLCEQAFELASPVVDYEETARENGWELGADGQWSCGIDDDGHPIIADSAQEACELDDVDPHECEVYEHWAVSKWLGEKLQEHGEKVDFDFCNMTVWARTCTGQAIKLDHVICNIYDSIMTPFTATCIDCFGVSKNLPTKRRK